MMKNERLYQAILDRHSVRQYQQEELPPEQLLTVESVASQSHSITSDSPVHFKFLNNLNSVDLMAAQGPYGRFVVSPHVVLPYSNGSLMPLVEIGFQAEQFCVRLCEIGLGTCYLGTAGREKNLMRHFDLPAGTEMGAAIVYGLPRVDDSRSLANYFRKPGKRTRRKPLDEIVSVDAYGTGGSIPAALEPIMVAAQYAPSAVNAQPWRFVLSESWLFLYVLPSVYPFVLSGKSKMTYALHDAGIVMANISLAYEAQSAFRNWVSYETDASGFPEAPAEAVPIAKIQL